VFAILKDFILDLTRKAYLNPFIIPAIDFDEVAHHPKMDETITKAKKDSDIKGKAVKKRVVNLQE